MTTNRPAPISVIQTRETSTSRYELRSDGIIAQRIRSTKTQSLADARENTAAFVELAAGEKRPLLVDLRVKFATDPGVREYYAGPEATAMVCSIAMVIDSTAGRLLGNFFLALQAPNVPTRMFAEEAAALDWLERLGPLSK
jgi:hypothetical protein